MNSRQVLATIVFSAAVCFQSNAKAQPLNARVASLQCGSLDGRGLTSIVYSGELGGQTYLNITNVNAFGFPFTQQARVDRIESSIRNSVVLTLRTMLTNGTIYLELVNGSTRGILSNRVGDLGGIQLDCNSHVELQ